MNVTGLHSQLMRVEEHPGWGKISAMCLEYWQRADQYYLVWDYVTLISGLREHLFYWERTAASFTALLTKSLQISNLNCDQCRSLRREWWKCSLCCLSSFCFNPVKHLKTPLWCSLIIHQSRDCFARKRMYSGKCDEPSRSPLIKFLEQKWETLTLWSGWLMKQVSVDFCWAHLQG